MTRSVVPSDFFQGGFPKYCAVTKPIRANNHMCSFDHALWNGLGEIISTVSIRDVMHKHPEKWLSVKLKDYYEYNSRTYRDNFLSGMYFSHLCVPFRKSRMSEAAKVFF